jgi:hypothetical protein
MSSVGWKRDRAVLEMLEKGRSLVLCLVHQKRSQVKQQKVSYQQLLASFQKKEKTQDATHGHLSALLYLRGQILHPMKLGSLKATHKNIYASLEVPEVAIS